jgi:tetratricopeptide (TPR) repeat protein
LPAAIPEAPIPAERLRSDNLVVREVRGFSRDRLVVTFDSYADDLRPDRLGFGERFFARHAVDAVHIIPRANDWYQYPEMPAAAELVSGIAAGYRRVVAYGSSMGGYAAIRFGRAVGASVAFALSPQFSIDPAVVPFEARWARDSERLDFALERCWDQAFVEKCSIVFDPHTPDRRHVELFAGHSEITAIEILGSGHPCTGFLVELGLLQQAVLAVLDAALDVDRLKREARALRKQSAQFYLALSMRARPLSWQAALAHRAVQIAPDQFICLIRYGMVLLKLGEKAEAERLFERARMLAPGNPMMLHALAEAYRFGGDYDRAAAAIAELIGHTPTGGEHFQRMLKRLRRRARQQRGFFRRGSRLG